jgi:kynurenine formamidase
MNDIPDGFHQWPGHTGNWNRWPNDRGALNLITPEVTLRGTRSVRTGQVVSCARTIRLHDPNNDSIRPAGHEMIYVRRGSGTSGDASADQMSFRMHGMINTHIDAFSHVGLHGYCFNGRRFDETVDMQHGASHCDITDLLGIVTRGVFIDVARRRGVAGLKPGDFVVPDDIQPLLDRLEPGDAAVIRTGVTLTGGEAGKPGPDGKPDIHYPIAGFHADCIELLGRKGASLLASDSPSDAYPSPLRHLCDSPVHRLCLVIFGMPLVHNMDLEELGRLQAGTQTSDFLFMVSPLNLAHATGSPCTPICVL